MRNGSYENSTVATVAQKLPEARADLRAARIDSTSRMSLRDAAAAAAIVPEEMLAQIEARLRRTDRGTADRVAELALAVEIAEDEEAFMLI